MVAQVVCVVCSISPEPQTTEITFHKFPCKKESPNVFKEWKNALNNISSQIIADFSAENCFDNAYICSRHFTASDFTFDTGKLILLKEAVPTRITIDQYSGEEDAKVSGDLIISVKDYEPSANSNNFASTLTKDFMTTSRHNLRSDLVCTDTSRALTPTVTEFTATSVADLKFLETLTSSKLSDDVLIRTRKRNAILEQKLQEFQKIFKRLRNDNLLTDTYVVQLQEQNPEVGDLLTEALTE